MSEQNQVKASEIKNAGPATGAAETSAAKAKPAGKPKAASPRKTAKAKKPSGAARKLKTVSAAPAKARTNIKPTKAKTMEKAMKQDNPFGKMAEEAAKGSKKHVDTLVKSGNIFLKGFEDITRTYMGWAQESAEKNSQAMKEIMGCKTINEFAEVQSKWAQQNFDDLMSGATRLTEMGVRVTTDALEPLNDQITQSLKKASDSLAA